MYSIINDWIYLICYIDILTPVLHPISICVHVLLTPHIIILMSALLKMVIQPNLLESSNECAPRNMCIALYNSNRYFWILLYYMLKYSLLCVLCEWNFDMKYYTDVVEYCLCETHFNFEIRMVILTAKM